MQQNHEPAAILSNDLHNPMELRYGRDYGNIGVSVDASSNRLIFDPKKIRKVIIIDAGDVVSIRRTFPVIGKPIEVGVPPAKKIDDPGIRIRFKGSNHEINTVSGLLLDIKNK